MKQMITNQKQAETALLALSATLGRAPCVQKRECGKQTRRANALLSYLGRQAAKPESEKAMGMLFSMANELGGIMAASRLGAKWELFAAAQDIQNAILGKVARDGAGEMEGMIKAQLGTLQTATESAEFGGKGGRIYQAVSQLMEIISTSQLPGSMAFYRDAMKVRSATYEFNYSVC